jgi:hypothetical protein
MWYRDLEMHGAKIRATVFWSGNDLVFHPRTEHPVLDLEELVLPNELSVDGAGGKEEQRM